MSAKERRERLKRAPLIAPETLSRLSRQHPTAHCELNHRSPFELLVAVVLSAQTTDVGVNKATPNLFERYPDAAALAAADPKDVEPFVAPLGFFRTKARSIVGLSRALVERHGGEVPRSLAELVKLPGVGRKTANVVLGVLWNTPEGVVVDTHVMRVSQRLGWTRHADAARIEQDLCAILPRPEWDPASHILIFHGRRCCFARKPDCPSCHVNDACPAAFDAEEVGRKPRRRGNSETDGSARVARPAARPADAVAKRESGGGARPAGPAKSGGGARPAGAAKSGGLRSGRRAGAAAKKRAKAGGAERPPARARAHAKSR
ncbi:MAG: endonuclease III [Myxococcales bacterium]|nr:endonuclease III [Myxococcales bacterium]